MRPDQPRHDFGHPQPATIGCGLNPNPIRREESDTPQSTTTAEFPAPTVTPNDEHTGRGEQIRQERIEGLRRAHQQRLGYHRLNHHHNNPQEPT